MILSYPLDVARNRLVPSREKLQGRYVYFCSEPEKYRSKLKLREQRKKEPLTSVFVANLDLAKDETRGSFCISSVL